MCTQAQQEDQDVIVIAVAEVLWNVVGFCGKSIWACQSIYEFVFTDYKSSRNFSIKESKSCLNACVFLLDNRGVDKVFQVLWTLAWSQWFLAAILNEKV